MDSLLRAAFATARRIAGGVYVPCDLLPVPLTMVFRGASDDDDEIAADFVADVVSARAAGVAAAGDGAAAAGAPPAAARAAASRRALRAAVATIPAWKRAGVVCSRRRLLPYVSRSEESSSSFA